MKKVWDKVSDVGVYKNLPSSITSRIRISNQISVITSFLALLYFVYALLSLPSLEVESERIFIVFHTCITLYSIPVLLLNYFRLYFLARLTIIVTVSVLTTINSLTLMQPFRTELYCFMTAAFIFVVFSEWKIIIPLYLSQVVLFYFSVKEIIANTPAITSTAEGLEFRTFVYFSTLYAILYFLRKETQRYKKQSEEQALQLSHERDEMEKLNFTKDKIFSIISHDLRNPIGSLKSMLELLKNEHITPEEFRKISGGLDKQVGHLHQSLNEMLTWSKAQLHGINPDPKETALRPMVQEISRISKMAARSKKIIITTSVPDSIQVYCDPNMLKSVISNLFSNAIKFTTQGGAISLFTESKNGHVKIMVEDTGVGISDQDKDKILNKNIHHTTLGTNNEKGTGLGLIMSKEFIEKNEGRFDIQSTQGKGSCFIIKLPKHGKTE